MTRQVRDRVSRLMAGGVQVAVGILGEVRESFPEEGVCKRHQRMKVPLAREEREMHIKCKGQEQRARGWASRSEWSH